MKKILIIALVCVRFFAKAQTPTTVTGPLYLNNSYSSGQYHYSRAAHDTIAADGHQLLVLDDSTTTVGASITLPKTSLTPYPGQFFSIVSMDSIATVTVHATATIQGTAVTALLPNKKVSWVYVYSARSKAYVWLRTE